MPPWYLFDQLTTRLQLFDPLQIVPWTTKKLSPFEGTLEIAPNNNQVNGFVSSTFGGGFLVI